MLSTGIERREVLVIGGGFAGLSAALTLGRARRDVLVLDGGETRNAPAAASHGFLSRDGTPPAELLRDARAQLAPYGVDVRAALAVDAAPLDGGFEVALADGTRVRAARLLLATGVRDVLPDVPGLRERWGQSVHACPYCHGWEVRGRRLAVLGRGEAGLHHALLLHQWSRDVALFTNGPGDLPPEAARRLAASGIPVIETPVARLVGEGSAVEALELADGTRAARDALFVRPDQEQRSELPARLGCDRAETGVHVRVDAQWRTSVPGVWAAGDMATPMQQVVAAAASGAAAAAFLNHALVMEAHAANLSAARA